MEEIRGCGIRSAQGAARSNAAAARRTAASCRRRPTIWSPTGRPLRVKPHGTEMAGRPVNVMPYVRKNHWV